MRLGIFGGTFNPIHFGHLRAAEEVRQILGLDKIIFMPSGTPPLKADLLAEASHRYLMTRLATGSNADFLVSDLEMRQDEKSYTVTTVERLQQMYPGDELFLILGLDAFLDLPIWKEPQRLVSLISFVVVTRPGADEARLAEFPLVEVLRPSDKPGLSSLLLSGGRDSYVVRVSAFDISSTMIRRLVKEGKSVRYLLPEIVEQYMKSHRLYSQ
ncbi:MAG: nicotinate-nucleotide adenylyltransferase [Dissulfurispiraceae bacterium]|jgi:nicotinate-nucleotide adenylyltransferase